MNCPYREAKIENIFLTIVMPALNEEKNIIPAIADTLKTFDAFGIKGEVVVINDGSRDSTPRLVQQLIDSKPGRVRMVSHVSPQGIGASFWDGVDNAQGNAVCMLPGDNENDPREIIRYVGLLNDVDMVIPFVFNKKTRSRSRNFISSMYLNIINTTFFTSLNYTNGTILYRKSLLKSLNSRNSGFFFQTDILIRLIREGYLFAEVPYRLRQRKEGSSKAIKLRALKMVIKGYLKLVRDIYFKKDKIKGAFAQDSVSAKRYSEL